MGKEPSAGWGYTAMVVAMLISSGNFVFGNQAVDHIDPLTLTFWRTIIGAICLVPFVLRDRGDLIGFFRQQKAKVLTLCVLGVILPPWFIYLSLRSDSLISLSVGYTFIPIMTVLFSALLLSERLSPLQYMGIAAALVGALIFAFQGDMENLLAFDPHIEFLWMLACCLVRSLYLVLLKRWDIHPKPSEGLFVLLGLGTLIVIPGLMTQGVDLRAPLDYPLSVWGSIAFIGIGMGAFYLHLITLGTRRVGATRASLFVYTVPILVTAEAILFLGQPFHVYEGVGALLVLGGVFVVTQFKTKWPQPSHMQPERNA